MPRSGVWLARSKAKLATAFHIANGRPHHIQPPAAATRVQMKSYLAIPDWQPLETALHDADAVLDRAATYLAGVRQFRSAIESKYVAASESFKSVPRLVYQTWPELAGDARRGVTSPSGDGSKAAAGGDRSVSSDADKDAAASPGASAKQSLRQSSAVPRSAGDPRPDSGGHAGAGSTDPSTAVGANTAPTCSDSDSDVSNPALESGSDAEAAATAPAGAEGAAEGDERAGAPAADEDTEASSQQADADDADDGNEDVAATGTQHGGGECSDGAGGI